MEKKRSSFTGKIGFVLAAAGSAVGLGNIWRFPYLAAQYGGGVFLLTYIVLSLTFGFTLMVTEIAIGRKTGLSAIGAFQKLNKKFTFLGYLGAIVPMLILPYYSVIGGWVTKYLTVFITGNGIAAADDSFFGGFVSLTGEPIGWFLIFIGATALIVLFGVEKGIEKVSKIMMPVLVVLSLFIAIYVCFMPGAVEGLKYYLVPNFENFSIKTVVAAMGQLFYSMSLAMGIMITYGSYMKKEVSIETSVHQIEIFDTGIAFLAGLIFHVFLLASPRGTIAQDVAEFQHEPRILRGETFELGSDPGFLLVRDGVLHAPDEQTPPERQAVGKPFRRFFENAAFAVRMIQPRGGLGCGGPDSRIGGRFIRRLRLAQMPDHIFQFVRFDLFFQPGVVFRLELRAGEKKVLCGVRGPPEMKQQRGGIVRADAFPERRNRLRGRIGLAEHAAEDAFRVRLLRGRPADFLPNRGGRVRTIRFHEALKPEHPRVATPGEELRPRHERGEPLRAEFLTAK